LGEGQPSANQSFRLTARGGHVWVRVISYEDVKIAPAYTIIVGIVVILLFSHTIGVGIFVDEWILTHLEAHWWRRHLLVGWKVTVLLSFCMVVVGLIHYKSDGRWESPLKVDEEGHPSPQSASQKTLFKNLMTAVLLALCFIATVLFVTFFATWDG